MEKVTSIGIRFMALFLLLTFSCVERKTKDAAAAIEIPADSIKKDETSYAVEIFEYRAEALKGYVLYGIYPFEDQPEYIIVENDTARLLIVDPDPHPSEQYSAIDSDDKDFDAIAFGEQKENESGIKSFNSLSLLDAQGYPVIFSLAMTKRSQEIGIAYRYVSDEVLGELQLTQTGDLYTFSLTTSKDEHICDVKGSMRVKGNVGYFSGGAYGTTCKLIFFFTEKHTQSLQIASNPDCGCGASVSLNQIFVIK